MSRLFLLLLMVSFSLGCTLLGKKEEASHPNRMKAFYLSETLIKAGLPKGFKRFDWAEDGKKESQLSQITQAIYEQFPSGENHADHFADSTGTNRWLLFITEHQREVTKISSSLDNLKIESFMQALKEEMEGWTLYRRGSTFRTKRHLDYAKYKHMLANDTDTLYVTRFVANVGDRTCTIYDLSKSEEDFEGLLSTLSTDK